MVANEERSLIPRLCEHGESEGGTFWIRSMVKTTKNVKDQNVTFRMTFQVRVISLG
jgi:hypothetical protein